MNTKVLVAGLIGGVASFLLGWLIWGILLMDMMSSMSNAACMRPEAEMNFILIGVANLVWGLLYAYIFSKWAGISTFSSGAMAGATLAAGIALAIDLMFYATTTMMNSTTGILVDILANIVVGAIVGGLIGMVLGRK